jgi:hypothetical protein
MDVEVERANGSPQRFVEDCVTCCRPIYFNILIGLDGGIVCDVKTEDEE